MKRPQGAIDARMLAAGACLLAVLTLAGCGDDPGGGTADNRPPSVWLVSAPPEGDSTSYRVHLEWGGSDDDGTIAYYEYSITDNDQGAFIPDDTVGADKWNRVYGEDSTFVFTADQWADTTSDDTISRFERSHTFFIRAVDDDGLASVEPAHRSFTAWTLSPNAIIVSPRVTGLTPAIMPVIGTYRWIAHDFINSLQDVQDPEAVRWILHPVDGTDFAGAMDFIRRNPHSEEWSPWTDYGAENDAGRSWTTPPMDLGLYVFAIQARDEAGAVTPVFDERENARRIRVATIDAGPLLDVYNEYIGTVRTAVAHTPLVIADLPAGLPLQFHWSADASSYGGTVVGYRYGWDIGDLDDPDQWEIDYTPFVGSEAASPPRTYFFGVHTFTVEVIDNNGFISRVEVKINMIQFTMSRDLLLVDDFNPNSAGIAATNGAVPNDDEHDAFWRDVLGDVAAFDPGKDVIAVSSGTELPITTIADYKAIIWDAYGGYNISKDRRPKLYDLIHFIPRDDYGISGKVQPDLLALFARVGGHLMVCGYQPMTQSITTDGIFGAPVKYPFVFKYELDGDQDGYYGDQIGSGRFDGEDAFPYRDGCLEVLDIAYPGVTNLRDKWNGCAVDEIHGVDPRTNGLREAIPIAPDFPRLELRSEVAAPGKYFAPESRGLNAEIYNPPYFEALCEYVDYHRPCFEPVYGHLCLDTGSVLYNAPVAFWSSVHADVVPLQGGGGAARSFFMGVEPYYFNPSQVRQMLYNVLFDEWGLTPVR